MPKHKHTTRERVLKVFRELYFERGLPPTVREVQQAIGVSSTSVARDHLLELVVLGEIIEVGEAGQSRRLIPADAYEALRQLVP